MRRDLEQAGTELPNFASPVLVTPRISRCRADLRLRCWRLTCRPVLAECGRTEQRRRWLPARSMAYFAMGMALHSEGSYEDVWALISDGIAWMLRDEGSGRLANKAAISHARDRLGPEPMALLFERVAQPLAGAETPGCWLAGRRLVAIDGTCLDLPDTAANDSHYGRPGVMKGERSAFPQARWSHWLRMSCPASSSLGCARECRAWPTAASPHGRSPVLRDQWTATPAWRRPRVRRPPASCDRR